MRVESFSVSNYRSFAERIEIRLRPLTLFYGYNSAGKSSLLRALPLLAASCSPDAAGPLALDSPILRGGSFADVRSRLTSSTKLTMGLSWADRKTGHESYEASIFDAESVREQVVESFEFTSTPQRTIRGIWEPTTEGRGLGKTYDIEIGEQSHETVLRFDGMVPFAAAAAHRDVYRSLQHISNQLRRFARAVHWLAPLRSVETRRQPYLTRPRRLDASGANVARVLAYDKLTDGPLLPSVSDWFASATGHTLDVIAEAEWFRVVVSPRDAPHAQIDLADTGEGLTQVLPVLVLALQARLDLIGKQPLLAIEHPELHLHPAAEVELASLFASLVRSRNESRTILETHSRNFLLAMQLAIVKGELSPDSLAVYWVRETSEGHSQATLVEFDSAARPIGDAWPPGVFLEELELSRAIVSARRAASGD